MKTKIIYISGDEVFDIRDIRAAFEEVRAALNLDKNTVLFGVPVDNEDAGFATKTDNSIKTNETPETIEQKIPEKETEPETIPEIIDEEIKIESIDEQPVKKRGRPRKENIVDSEPGMTPETTEKLDEKVVPILSVLSTKEETIVDNAEIIPEISDETIEKPTDENDIIQSYDNDADLEKLLSEMTPLDVSEDQEPVAVSKQEQQPDTESEDFSVDLTLEQLATEFAENQDKIKSETKTSSRNRIGKLRNILPFKQSKHKDTGLGDLFGWAGIAANDEEFSVPGFFTNAASRK